MGRALLLGLVGLALIVAAVVVPSHGRDVCATRFAPAPPACPVLHRTVYAP